MDIAFTGRGIEVTEEIRATAEHKFAPLGRIEPRASTLAVEFINEHHPRLDGNKRVEAALRIPRRTFRAHAEAADVSSAIDLVREKLERQVRDHHGRRRFLRRRGVGSAESATPSQRIAAEGAEE